METKYIKKKMTNNFGLNRNNNLGRAMKTTNTSGKIMEKDEK